MRILAAFDKYKDSMTADQACSIAASCIRESMGSSVDLVEAPMTDGGEGFCPILTKSANGQIKEHHVCGPLGRPVKAPIGWVSLNTVPPPTLNYFGNCRGNLAIIEMASAAGLEQVPESERDPHHTTSRGVGELIRIAADQGAAAILLGIGGSATNDLGLGALEAMGLSFSEANRIIPKKWASVHQMTGFIDGKMPPVFIACDVDNPLLGPQGATAVYGPQKGLLSKHLNSFEREADRISALLCRYFGHELSLRDQPGCGAAGGIGFGLKAACGAEFIPGFDLVKAWLNLEMQVAASDLILTGEGSFDQSSLAGKGPYSLLELAQKSGTKVLLLPGHLDAATAARVRMRFPNVLLQGITPADCPLQEALRKGPLNLKETLNRVLRETVL